MIIGNYTADVGAPRGFVLFRGKWLTYEIPGASWVNPTGINNKNEIAGQFIGSSGARGYVTVVPVTPAAPNNFGACACSSTSAGVAEGNPINVGTGNKFQSELDLEDTRTTGISLRRYYNSQDTTATAFGTGWRSTWDRSVLSSNANTVEVVRVDGRRDTFAKDTTGNWVSNPDVTSRLIAVTGAGVAQTGWQLTQPNDDIESYNLAGRLMAVTSRAGLTTTLTYNAAGQLTTVTGPFGHTLTFAYDATGKVSQVTAPDGQVTKYGYDAKSNLISVTYPDGTKRQYVYENASFPSALTGIIDEKGARFATYAYDAQGRAVSTEHAGGTEKTAVAYTSDGTATITQPNGATRAYAFQTQFDLVKPTALTGTPYPAVGGKAFDYDANGFLSKVTDYKGNVTTYVHDARGLETSRTEAAGTPLARTIATAWHPTFHLPTQISEPGRTIGFSYDAKGNLTNKTITAGTLSRSWAYTYSTLGQVLSADGPRAGTIDVTRYTYDTKGNLATATDALGRITKFTSYDANGRLLQMQDPNGLVTTNGYDTRGRLISRSVGGEVTNMAYDAAGQLTRLTRPDGSYLAFIYDAAHRLTRLADAAGNKVVYALDVSGNVRKEDVQDAAGTVRRTQSHLYDQVNRLAQDIGAAGQKTIYAHDANGNLTGVTDPLGYAMANTFDALNRVVKVKDAAGGTTAYGYDANDRLTKVTDPRALATAYSYDGLDDNTAVQSPDTGKTIKLYDAAGNPTTMTDARSVTTSNVYDALNRLTGTSASDGTTVSFVYDQGLNGLGRLTGMTDPAATTDWSYDPHGRVIQRNQKIGTLTLTTSYSYDTAGRLIGMTYPSGKMLSFAYDALGHVKSIAAGTQTLLTAVAYEPFGPVAGWTLGSGATYSIVRDKDGDPISLQWGTGATISRSIQLGYDADKQITSLSDSASTLASYGYDKLAHLTGYTAGAASQTFTYDADGNRTGLVANAMTTSYQYPAASNRLASRSEGAVTTTYTYDAAGNLTGDGSRSFAYDGRGRLVKVTVGGAVTQYALNGLGQRVAKTGPGVPTGRNIYIYDEAGHLIGEYNNAGNLLKEYVWLGDLPVAVITPAATYYVMPHNLGAPWTVVDATGKVVWSWNRDPFGTTQPTGSITYNLRFPGQYYDKETGLSYNYYRDYDPKLGRYIQSDPIGLGGGVNTYAYVGGNPVSAIDPRGLEDVLEAGMGAFQDAKEDVTGVIDKADTYSPYIAFFYSVREQLRKKGSFDIKEAIEYAYKASTFWKSRGTNLPCDQEAKARANVMVSGINSYVLGNPGGGIPKPNPATSAVPEIDARGIETSPRGDPSDNLISRFVIWLGMNDPNKSY